MYWVWVSLVHPLPICMIDSGALNMFYTYVIHLACLFSLNVLFCLKVDFLDSLSLCLIFVLQTFPAILFPFRFFFTHHSPWCSHSALCIQRQCSLEHLPALFLPLFVLGTTYTQYSMNSSNHSFPLIILLL